MTNPQVVVVTTGSHRKWQWWRDLVNIGLAVAVAMLVVLNVRSQGQITALQDQLTTTTALRAQQVAGLTADLAQLQASLDQAGQLTAAKDTEIRRLAQLVVQLGGNPRTNRTPGSDAAPSSFRSPAPSPAPGPTARPSPRPSPSASRSPRPSPEPTVSPTSRRCAVSLLGLCLLPGG